MSPEIKRCPYCDEDIRQAAIKCKHCGSILADASDLSDLERRVGAPDKIAEYKIRAEVYRKDGSYKEAESEIRKALELDPSDKLLATMAEEIDALIQERHLSNASALKKAYKLEEAVFELRAALDRNPKNRTARRRLKEASGSLDRLNNHLQRGDAYRKQKKLREAIEEYEHALKINPQHKYARSEADQCRLIRDERDLLTAKASEDLEAATSDYESNRYGGAMSGARKILEKIPDHPGALALLESSKKERFKSRRNILVVATALIAAAVYAFALDGIWAYSQYRSSIMEARAASQNGDWQEAIEKCRKALEYRPDSEEAGKLLSDSVHELDRFVADSRAEALRAGKGAAKAGAPRHAKALYEQAQRSEREADSLLEAGDYLAARRQFAKAADEYEAARKEVSAKLAGLKKLELELEQRERRKAELAQSKARLALARADDERAGEYGIGTYSTARARLKAGNKAFLGGEPDVAIGLFDEAANLFMQSARDAEDGAFLPAGLEKSGGKIVSPVDGAEMIFVPAGSFSAGSRPGEGSGNEHPRHRVDLQAFYMDKYEVTVGRYKVFLRAKGRDSTPGSTLDSSSDNHPVVGVTREDAEAYAEWAGKRLPTEAEWEYACRAGTSTRYGVGNSIDHDKANYAGARGKDRWNSAAPVGSFAPNAWGLFDMSGNVWEWCRDWYSRNYYANCPTDRPRGPSKGTQAVMRGGSWKESEYTLRSAVRGYYPPGDSRDDLGFRCAK